VGQGSVLELVHTTAVVKVSFDHAAEKVRCGANKKETLSIRSTMC